MTVNSFENQLKVIEFSFFLYLILQDYKILCFCCNTDDCMNQEKGLRLSKDRMSINSLV